MNTRFVGCLILFLYPAILKALEIDLASSPSDMSIYGGVTGEETGQSLQVGDINGDGSKDLLFIQTYWVNTAQDEVGRVCAYFGPIVVPEVHDLFDETPPFCVEATRQTPLFHVETSLLAADIDGDGIEDLIFSTISSFVIFAGRATWPPVLLVSDADWSFAADIDDRLTVAAAGDLNGDDATDLVLFSSSANGPSGLRDDAGEGFIFFGPASSWPKQHFDLAVDSPDVLIYGADGRRDNPPLFGGDQLGIREGAALVAQFLGDDTPDLIVTAQGSAGPDNLLQNVGAVYVLKGRGTWPSTVDLRTPGAADLLVHGPNATSGLRSVAVGDVDGDLAPDLLITLRGYSRPGLGRASSGGIFVLRGGRSMPGVWDLATTPADSIIVGPAINSSLGWSITLADVNGDSYVDIVAGSDEIPLIRPSARAVVAVSGCEGLEPLRDLAIKPAELTIYGGDESDFFGRPVRAWDFDRDGRDDILASAYGSDGLDDLRGDDAGEIHLILGRPFGTPVCVISPDPGLPIEVCGITTDITLDGSPSVITSCSATPQYRWMDGTTELRGWDVDPTFVVRPTATTDYRLEIRCGDCAGPCFDTATVLVTVDPDVIPPSLGNTVRAYRSGTDVELAWGSVTEARSHSLYRSTTKGVWLPPFLEDIPGTTQTLPDISDPDSYFYRVAGASCSGMEGP